MCVIFSVLQMNNFFFRFLLCMLFVYYYGSDAFENFIVFEWGFWELRQFKWFIIQNWIKNVFNCHFRRIVLNYAMVTFSTSVINESIYIHFLFTIMFFKMCWIYILYFIKGFMRFRIVIVRFTVRQRRRLLVKDIHSNIEQNIRTQQPYSTLEQNPNPNHHEALEMVLKCTLVELLLVVFEAMEHKWSLLEHQFQIVPDFHCIHPRAAHLVRSLLLIYQFEMNQSDQNDPLPWPTDKMI